MTTASSTYSGILQEAQVQLHHKLSAQPVRNIIFKQASIGKLIVNMGRKIAFT